MKLPPCDHDECGSTRCLYGERGPIEEQPMTPLEQAAKALLNELPLAPGINPNCLALITKHMEAVAAEAVKKALAEVKCYNCGEMAVRL